MTAAATLHSDFLAIVSPVNFDRFDKTPPLVRFSPILKSVFRGVREGFQMSANISKGTQALPKPYLKP